MTAKAQKLAAGEPAPGAPADPTAAPNEVGAGSAPAEGAQGTRTQPAFGTSAVTLEMTASAAGRGAREPIRDSQSFDDLAPPIADPLIGVVVAERYRILELLGRGGMGIVYRVEHVRIGKLLAMKLLTGELSRNAEVVRRFKHEALTASKLSSPNTVQVFDFGVSDGLTYLVMELVAGEDLGRALRALGPMPTQRLARILIQVCSSLAEAHQKSIVHRDIKPENIMLVRARDGTDIAKVLDFGLAKLREGSELNDVTSQGAIVGTPYFMSPEQVRGDPVDARSDIYSLGAVMYRAATGHYPFNGPTPMAVFTKHLTELPIPPAERVPELGISRKMNDIIMRALAKSPSDRYQRIEDLQADLLEEARKLSSSSVDDLIDSTALREMQKGVAVAERSAVAGVQVAPVEIATRDEVERYERKLRRKRWGLLAFVTLVPVGAAGWGAHYAMNRPTVFSGWESEPNDGAAEATVVPFGTAVAGHIGRRIDASSGDRDFYAIDVPDLGAADGGNVVKLRVTALPNFATCTFLYTQGHATAMAQYCVGRPARDLVIEALHLAPGRYFLTVAQDLDPYGRGEPLYVHENVSDAYEVTVSRATVAAGTTEVEPNDRLASANTLELDRPLDGTIGWVTDEDVFCTASGGQGRARFVIDEPGRDRGAVLEVTPLFSSGAAPGVEGPAVRVHGRLAEAKGDTGESDKLSPWASEPLDLGSGSSCIRLRIAPDPWTPSASHAIPKGSLEPYRVTLELVP